LSTPGTPAYGELLSPTRTKESQLVSIRWDNRVATANRVAQEHAPEGKERMAKVYVEPRPKSRDAQAPITHYVVEDSADSELHSS
jgi:hypothetical protein